MVGALADWFAVTALFRHPLGIPIPHTAIIPNRKDEIGRTLGEFVETEFLRGDVVRTKLQATAIAARGGEWLRVPAHAERVAAEGSAMASGILRGPQRRRCAGRDRGARARAPHHPRMGTPARRMARQTGGVRRAPRRGRSRRRQCRHLAGGQSGGLLGTGLTPAADVASLGCTAARRRHGLQRGPEVRGGRASRPAASRAQGDRRLPRPPRGQPSARPRDDRSPRRREGQGVRQPARARARRRGVEHGQVGPALLARRPRERAPAEGGDGDRGDRRSADDRSGACSTASTRG